MSNQIKTFKSTKDTIFANLIAGTVHEVYSYVYGKFNRWTTVCFMFFCMLTARRVNGVALFTLINKKPS